MPQLSETDILVRGVGDLLLASTPPPHRGEGIQDCANLLQDADIAFGNMEAPLVDGGIPISKLDVARSGTASAPSLRALGFRILSVANNHIMDYGTMGLRSTTEALDDAGLTWAGAGNDTAQAFAPKYFHCGGRRIAFLACHAYFNANWLHYTDPIRATDHRSGAAVIQGFRVRMPGAGSQVLTAPEEAHLARLVDAVKEARSSADLVLMSLHTHWDKDDVDRVTEARQTIVRASIDAGVDLVLGHGPHVVNGVEYYNGRFALHSLGNFFFCIPHSIAELYPATRPFINVMVTEDRFWLGMMVDALFSDGRPPDQLTLRPVVIERGNASEGLPRIGGREAAVALKAVLDVQSEPLGVRFDLEEDGTLTARPAGVVAAKV